MYVDSADWKKSGAKNLILSSFLPYKNGVWLVVEPPNLSYLGLKLIYREAETSTFVGKVKLNDDVNYFAQAMTNSS